MRNLSQKTWDVIIIGAGAAGLAAAQVFRKARVSFLILEARDILGGRAQTLKRKNQIIELGAELIHGKVSQVKKLAGRIIKQKDIHYILDHRKYHKVKKYWSHMKKLLKKLKEKMIPLYRTDFIESKTLMI